MELFGLNALQWVIILFVGFMLVMVIGYLGESKGWW